MAVRKIERGHYFEDFEVGRVFKHHWGRTINEGDNSLFTSDECVEAAWTVVDQVLNHEQAVSLYEPGSWGPVEATKIISGTEGWHNPVAEASEPC